ncbi:MAG: transposase [Steroidobacteraceae bacterium]
MTLFADADPDPERRRVLFVAEGREAETVQAFAANLRPCRQAHPDCRHQHRHVPGVHQRRRANFPNAQITFDKFHVIAHASAAIDAMRRAEQKLDPSLKGLRWTLLKDRSRLGRPQRAVPMPCWRT